MAGNVIFGWPTLLLQCVVKDLEHCIVGEHWRFIHFVCEIHDIPLDEEFVRVHQVRERLVVLDLESVAFFGFASCQPYYLGVGGLASTRESEDHIAVTLAEIVLRVPQDDPQEHPVVRFDVVVVTMNQAPSS